jgi:hypothetical protein
MKKVVGKALAGKGKANHTHEVVLVGSFKKQESREPEHRHRRGIQKRRHSSR